MIAIKNGRIITPDEVIDSKTLLIENDRIISITGEKVSADQGYKRARKICHAGIYRRSLG